MMENRNWREGKSSELIDLISGFAFKSANFLSENRENTLPIIKIKNVANGDVNLNDVVYHEYNDKLSNYVIEKGDVLIAMTGNHIHAQTQIVGDVSLCKLDDPVLLNQRVGKFVAKNDADLKFAYYLFKDEETRFNLANKASGSANQANVSKTDILDLDILIPPLPEQKAIASVLSSLDDKIDLLHQQNQTLEALAETLFRQWFIEEAKEDWEDCTIEDLAIHSKISVHPNRNPDTLYHHYSIPAFDANKKPVVELGKEIQSNKYKVEENSILFSKLNPHKDKRVWLIQDNVEEHAICSTELQVVKPKDKDYLYFIYGWLTNSIYYNEIASGVGGTSGSHQRIEPKAIFTAPCVKIEKDIIFQYNSHAEPLFKKQYENQQQIQTLTKLRDTLLPKLMSGEVKVKN